MANPNVNDYDKSLNDYFNKIKDFKPYTLKEEITLWEDYKKNNNFSSRNKLFNANCKFVVNVAKSFRGRGVSMSDLISEGNIGLLNAIDRYDPTRNVKIFSYGVWWIKQAMQEAIEKRNFIPSEELPTEKNTDLPQDDMDNAQDSEINELPEIFIDEDNNEISRTEEQKKVINDALCGVSKRDALMLLEYYGVLTGKPKTLEELGVKYNLTKERIRQINKKTIKKMRTEMLNNSITRDIYKR